MTQHRFPAFFILLMSVLPLPLHAQSTSVNPPVQEQELALCLKTELQARERFAALEVRANELRSTEELLKDRRAALGREKTAMDSRKQEPARVSRYNEDIREFNQRTDQLNTAKDIYQQDYQAYDNWMNSDLKPACNKLNGRPVPPVTLFHACEHHLASSKLQQLPYCSTLPDLAAMKTCISKAGSKAKAQETCNTRE
jgi:hypothetical protein